MSQGEVLADQYRAEVAHHQPDGAGMCRACVAVGLNAPGGGQWPCGAYNMAVDALHQVERATKGTVRR